MLIGRLSGLTFLFLDKGMMGEASPSHRSPRPAACVPLEGIEVGGTPAEGGLDQDVIEVALLNEAFNPSTSIIPLVAGCSAGLETPISMRVLLGEKYSLVPLTIPAYVVLIVIPGSLRQVPTVTYDGYALSSALYV